MILGVLEGRGVGAAYGKRLGSGTGENAAGLSGAEEAEEEAPLFCKGGTRGPGKYRRMSGKRAEAGESCGPPDAAVREEPFPRRGATSGA